MSDVPAMPDMKATRPELSNSCSEDSCSLSNYDLSH